MPDTVAFLECWLDGDHPLHDRQRANVPVPPATVAARFCRAVGTLLPPLGARCCPSSCSCQRFRAFALGLAFLLGVPLGLAFHYADE